MIIIIDHHGWKYINQGMIPTHCMDPIPIVGGVDDRVKVSGVPLL